jgi:hypothetical protein
LVAANRDEITGSLLKTTASNSGDRLSAKTRARFFYCVQVSISEHD